MSLPVVLPGSCCPVTGASVLAEPSYRNRPRGLCASSHIASGGSRLLLPGRPLLSLGLLQLLLGGCMVTLSFGALSLSNSPPIRNSCPFWAGSSVILSGIVGLTTWRRPMLLLIWRLLWYYGNIKCDSLLQRKLVEQVNVFVLLSVVCVLLNLAGFILCCQGAQLVSSMTSCQLSEDADVCYCCSLSHTSKCPEAKLLELHPAQSCSTMRILLKKVLYALCALNALTTAVCLMAAALRYLQIFTARTPYMNEPRAAVEEREEPTQVMDPDEFVAPAPPPSYFSTFYTYTPRLAHQILGDRVIPLPHIYGARIKGVEVFCPPDTPPPYEAIAGSSTNAVTQEIEIALTEVIVNSATTPPPPTCIQDMSPQMTSVSTGIVQANLQLQLPPQKQQHTTGLTNWKKGGICRSNSDPVLMDLAAKVWSSSNTPLAPFPHTTDSATQTSLSTLAAHSQGQVTLRQGNNNVRNIHQPRPSSMVDYKSYRDTKLLVRKILDQPATQGLAPEVQELVDSIRNVLQSDQEHMEEAVRCASYIEQVFTDSEISPSQPKPPQQQPVGNSSQTFPHLPKRRSGLMHLQSCGDLSFFTCAALESLEHQGNNRKDVSKEGFRMDPRAGLRSWSRLNYHDHPRPHSLIGVFRETVL